MELSHSIENQDEILEDLYQIKIQCIDKFIIIFNLFYH